MGVPRKRKSVRIGEFLAPNGENFSVYKNWTDSVKDYVIYLDYFKMPLNLNSCKAYVTKLQSQGYAEDPNYIKKVVKICDEG